MLAGQPARFSPTLKVHDTAWSDGLIKLYIGQSRMGIVIVPSLLFCKESSWRFLQPRLFGPCMIDFNVSPGLRVTPRMVELRSDERLKCYEDGAQLYRCRLQGADKFAPISSGVCHRLSDGDFALELFPTIRTPRPSKASGPPRSSGPPPRGTLRGRGRHRPLDDCNR